MDKEEIKYIMAIIRPVITALYDRQKLKLTAFSLLRITYYNEFMYPEKTDQLYDISGLFQVRGKNCSYVLKVEEDIVTSLSVGELNV